ncbi:hypothetical protein FVEG_14990 [Fusarium verticillioides 7600]|uniref:Uncharacterized protein n=1 Tax=Gibberella moniliformis (strain M3125 / FGSC 7600) TaxID=334819 RepID=W7M2X9_GIBM7|nr:hypothetical protein FVEG_14990 [Fusarium verticillioides 7600]EWG39272.1 hypothetical protein FVEG_14990 [Fusarium verticillioides 7600]
MILASLPCRNLSRLYKHCKPRFEAILGYLLAIICEGKLSSQYEIRIVSIWAPTLRLDFRICLLPRPDLELNSAAKTYHGNLTSVPMISPVSKANDSRDSVPPLARK